MLEAGRLVSSPIFTLSAFKSRDAAIPTNQHFPPQPFSTQDRCKHCTGRSQHRNPRAANKFYTACAVEDIASVELSTKNTGIVVGNFSDVFGDVHPNISDTSSEADLSPVPRLMVAADIDAATAKLAIGILGPFLSAFGFLFILRIVMSWYPKLPVEKFPYVIVYAPTEPLLAVTRKVIPPLAGVDVTPVVWFGLVSFLNEILVGPQGLLVLLSQQLN